MIVRRRLDFIRLGRSFGLILSILLTYDILVTLLYIFGWHWVSIGNLPLSLFGSAIALVVAFRNNAAYNRWWEARGLWGQIVNSTRSFARGMQTMTADVALQSRLIRYQIAFVLALRCSLLRLDPWEIIQDYLSPDVVSKIRSAANVPNAIQNLVGRELLAANCAGSIDTVSVSALTTILNDLSNAQGGIERIKKTPLPRQYNQFPQVFTCVYCLLLPIVLVQDMGFMTPIGSTLIGFMFLTLDQIGRDLEDPFEGTIHDLPVHSITRTIEIDLLQTIGAHDIPKPIDIRDGILW